MVILKGVRLLIRPLLSKTISQEIPVYTGGINNAQSISLGSKLLLKEEVNLISEKT